MGVVVVAVNDEQRDDELWCLDPGNFDVRKNKLVWQHRGTLALFLSNGKKDAFLKSSDERCRFVAVCLKWSKCINLKPSKPPTSILAHPPVLLRFEHTAVSWFSFMSSSLPEGFDCTTSSPNSLKDNGGTNATDASSGPWIAIEPPRIDPNPACK